MPHTYTRCLMHCVFSTKDRKNTLSAELRARLWPYLGGIARENGMRAMTVGGTENHVHVLLSLGPTMSVSKALQLIKGGSSKWIHDTFPAHRDFAWQEAYGAFSIGVSQVDDTIAYINAQDVHHRTRTFEEEYIGFLRKHGIEFDERYVWG
jgi:putative transposase